MTRPDPGSDRSFARAMLPRVSRTFALGIRLLPSELEHAVRTAYLLCRIADTIEDSIALQVDDKVRLLKAFRACLDNPDAPVDAIQEPFRNGASAEEELAARSDRVLRQFHELSAPEREAIGPWVREMAGGMAEFAGARAAELGTLEELERYCYFVAGTVGHLLTDLFRVHNRGVTSERHRQLDALATSFGLGLQLTNIIKDVADDRRRGRSFVPSSVLAEQGLRPGDLHDPARREAARAAMNRLIAKAREHLHDALRYCTTLPTSAYRIRIFCLTSLYFAVRTLRLAERDPRLLDPSHKVKITRAQVYRTVGVAHLVAPANPLVRGYYRMLAG